MTINENTEMLLFRFSNYRKNAFIKEHQEVLEENGYTWMLKIGKRSSISKLYAIKKEGGWIILRSPKADGSVSYIARFTDIKEEEPEDSIYPRYYNEIFENEDEDYYSTKAVYQWFKIDKLVKLADTDVKSLVVSKSGKTVNEVIGTTRTAVMFIKNDEPIII